MNEMRSSYMIDLFVLERNLFGNRVSKQHAAGKGAHGIASPYSLGAETRRRPVGSRARGRFIRRGIG
jgi:hypothetical protein